MRKGPIAITFFFSLSILILFYLSLDNKKIYHKFDWLVEKYTEEGPLKDCWLTTMVSSPVSLGSSI